MQLIYFSAVPWASFRQRPQEFAIWAHERLGAKVLWVEPYPVRFPAMRDLSRPRVSMPVTDQPDWLQVLRVQSLPVEPTAPGRLLNRALFWPRIMEALHDFVSGDPETILAIGKPSDLALHAIQEFPKLQSIYDAMDDFPQFHTGAARSVNAAIESQIASRCASCSTSSSHLAERLRVRNPNVLVVPNGLALDRMPAFTPQSEISQTIGYVGTLGNWFDWPWLAELAASWPDRRIEIHGPMFSRPTVTLPPNVSLHPPLAHDKALAKMREFGAGLIPFLRNELTASVDPVKFYEYRALGLPVISTPFGEMLAHCRTPRVLLTEHPAADRAHIADLLSTRDTAESVCAFRSANSWSCRFETLAHLLLPQ